MRFNNAPGATPLDEDAIGGLLVDATTQAELNSFEALAIEEARIGIADSRKLRQDFPNDEALKWLHAKMFGIVWGWAGTYRSRETNIGVAPKSIAADVRNLCMDVKSQLSSGRDEDEVSAVFHHR